MSSGSPILQYARAGSSIDDTPGAKRIQLARPAAWPRVVFDSLVLPIVVLAALFLLLWGVVSILNMRGLGNAFTGVVLLLVAMIPTVVAWQFLLELASLRRAGKRPIVLVLHDRILLIDDAAQRTTGAIEVRREQVKSLELTPQPMAVMRQKVWTLRVTGFETELAIQYIESDDARARAVLDQIKICLYSFPLRQGGA